MTERFSASVAGRHMACHASANLDKAIPGWVAPVKDPKAGRKGEGSMLHELFAQVMELRAKEMYYFAKALEYASEIRSRRRFNVLIEESIKATWLVNQPQTQVDCVLHTQDEMHIIDWKAGKIPVEVIDNEQLLFYAACFAPLAPKAKGVTVHIVQPWADNMNSWFVDTNRLGQFMAEAQATEAAVNAGDLSFGPSDHCTFCPANPHSRGDKGTPLCPPMLRILYPGLVDEDAILNL